MWVLARCHRAGAVLAERGGFWGAGRAVLVEPGRACLDMWKADIELWELDGACRSTRRWLMGQMATNRGVPHCRSDGQ